MITLVRMIPALVVMGIIFFLSSFQGDEIELPSFPGADKLAHVLAYAVLTAAYLFAFGRKFRLLKPHLTMMCCFGLTILYSISDEFHQSFVPNRTPDIYDIFADALGALILLMIWRFFLMEKEARLK